MLESSKIALTSTITLRRRFPLQEHALDRDQPSSRFSYRWQTNLKNICAACRSKGKSRSFVGDRQARLGVLGQFAPGVPFRSALP